MIFQMASTSAYDENEVQVCILAEKGDRKSTRLNSSHMA